MKSLFGEVETQLSKVCVCTGAQDIIRLGNISNTLGASTTVICKPLSVDVAASSVDKPLKSGQALKLTDNIKQQTVLLHTKRRYQFSGQHLKYGDLDLNY